jgi:hypothetical protein
MFVGTYPRREKDRVEATILLFEGCGNDFVINRLMQEIC